MDGFRNVYLCRGPSYHRELSGPVRPLNAVGIYSGGSSDGTRISRCPAHLLKINAKWITLPDRQQARHCHVMICLPTDARISCVYKGVLEVLLVCTRLCLLLILILHLPPQTPKAQSPLQLI